MWLIFFKNGLCIFHTISFENDILSSKIQKTARSLRHFEYAENLTTNRFWYSSNKIRQKDHTQNSDFKFYLVLRKGKKERKERREKEGTLYCICHRSVV